MGRVKPWKSPLATPADSMLTPPLWELIRPLIRRPKEQTPSRQNAPSLSLILKVRPSRLTVQTRTGFNRDPARRLWIQAPRLSIHVLVQRQSQPRSPDQAEQRPLTQAWRGPTLSPTPQRTAP